MEQPGWIWYTKEVKLVTAVACVGFVALLGCETKGRADTHKEDKEPSSNNMENNAEKIMQPRYIEIVTPDVETVIATYTKIYGVTFSEPVAAIGNARTAELPGGMLSVRGPLRPDESPIMRAYLEVSDINEAFKAAETTGAELAFPPTKLAEYGTFAIYIIGGVEHGLWQR